MTYLLKGDETRQFQAGRNAQQRGEQWQIFWTIAQIIGWYSGYNRTTPTYTADHPFVAVSVEDTTGNHGSAELDACFAEVLATGSDEQPTTDEIDLSYDDIGRDMLSPWR